MRAQQDEAWKLTLLNQFHDIIPGSSIGWVYQDAMEQMASVRETVDSHTVSGLRRLAARMDATGLVSPVMVFNATSAPQRGVMEHAGELVYVDGVASLGVRVIDGARSEARIPRGKEVRVDGLRVSNGLIEAEFDDRGRVMKLGRIGASTPISTGDRELGEMVLYEDHPRHWDAWDIDPEYTQKASPIVFKPEDVRMETTGPLRAKLVRRASFGSGSSIIQEYVLDADSPQLEVRTTVDWRESHRLLRAVFPTALRASHATYSCAFGHIERSTKRNTSHERAAFEVSGHHWVNLSDRDSVNGAGLAVLNDCKYGHSCHDGEIGLSLLRAPKFPDDSADIGMHRFTYAMMPHDGDWREAGVDARADLLNTPLMGWTLEKDQPGDLGNAWAPISIKMDGGAPPMVAAFKAAEEDDRLILRIVETRGRRGVARVHWNIGVRNVTAVDLLEKDSEVVEASHDEGVGVTTVMIRPFGIVTLAAHRA